MADLPPPGTVVQADHRYIPLDPKPLRLWLCSSSYLIVEGRDETYESNGWFKLEWPIVEPTEAEIVAFAKWRLTN